MNNYVSFNIYQHLQNSVVTNRVSNFDTAQSTTYSEKPEEVRDFSDSHSSSDAEELTKETIQEAYETMFNKWFLVIKMNKSLPEQVNELIKENDVFKRATVNYYFQAVKTEKKLQELKHTEKSLKMMNSDIAKLDHILSLGKVSVDHHGLVYTGESSNSNIVFVKETPAPKPPTTPSKNVAISLS